MSSIQQQKDDDDIFHMLACPSFLQTSGVNDSLSLLFFFLSWKNVCHRNWKKKNSSFVVSLSLSLSVCSVPAAVLRPDDGRGRPGRWGRDARVPFQPGADGQTSHLLLDPRQHQREGQRRHWWIATREELPVNDDDPKDFFNFSFFFFFSSLFSTWDFSVAWGREMAVDIS